MVAGDGGAVAGASSWKYAAGGAVVGVDTVVGTRARDGDTGGVVAEAAVEGGVAQEARGVTREAAEAVGVRLAVFEAAGMVAEAAASGQSTRPP